MSFFNCFLSLFKRNIVCSDVVERHLIYMYPLKRRRIRVNSNIVVRRDFVACFVLGNRISDMLRDGKHRINGSTLPTTFDRLRLGKANKRGKLKKRFRADVYFINLKQFENLQFYSDEPFIAKSEKFGKIRGFCEGVYNINVTEPDIILKYFLNRVAYVKNDYAFRQINIIVGNVVNQVLEKSRLSFSEILLNPSKLKQYLNPHVEETLLDIGLKVTNVELTSLKLTKKIQKRVNEFLSGNASFTGEEDGMAVQVFKDTEPEQNFVMPEKILVDIKHEKISAETKEGVTDISESGAMQTATIAQNMPKNFASAGDGAIPSVNPLLQRRMGSAKVLQQQQQPQPQNNYTNADLNASEVFTNAKNYKICKYCNEKIEEHYKFCPKCGVKQII